jgi:hypothetical protein
MYCRPAVMPPMPTLGRGRHAQGVATPPRSTVARAPEAAGDCPTKARQHDGMITARPDRVGFPMPKMSGAKDSFFVFPALAGMNRPTRKRVASR